MFKWLFPEPTPDEALIAELKEAVTRVAELGEEAKSRGITVYLKTSPWRGADYFNARSLRWGEAFKTKTERFG